MNNCSRDPARPTRDPLPADDSVLIELISRGHEPAFAALVDRTSEAAAAALPTGLSSPARRGQMLAASYLEVWWLAGCHRAPQVDATDWITGIVRRRTDEESRGMSRFGAHPAPAGSRPTYAELEVATLLGRPVADLPWA